MRSIESCVATTSSVRRVSPVWRLGGIPYLNAEPFGYGLRRMGLDPVSAVPSHLARLMCQGHLDAAPLPVVDWFRLAGEFEPLGDFCIASPSAAQSVLLFSRRPIEALEGAVIAITPETSTSGRLLRVLLSRKYGLRSCRYQNLGEPGDAFLLIGDQALRQRSRERGFPHVYDLGTEWHEWTGLPFVFALWVSRRDLGESAREELRSLLAWSLVRGLRSIDHIAAARLDTGLRRDEIVRYLHGFEYVLGAPERAGLREFRALLHPGQRGGPRC